MSIYTDSVASPHRQSTRYYDYPARRSADLSTGPRLQVYEKEPISLPRRYADSDRELQVVKSRPIRVRTASPDDDYQRTPRRESLVIRPRSTSRVRIVEPAALIVDSSSEDEPRRSRRGRGDDTRIRATSRPGKKNDYAFVRTPSKKRRKSASRVAVVHDLELKTDRKHKDFQNRRNDLENTEARALVRARSRDREILVDDESDLDVYDGRRRRSNYGGGSGRKRGSIDNSRREIIIGRDDRDRDHRRRSIQEPKQYNYGKGLVVAGDEEDLRSDRAMLRRRRVSLSPDRDSVDPSSLGGGVRRASRRSRGYDDIVDSEPRRDPRRDSAYYTDGERRAKEREREAIDREKRAIDREKAALDREKLLVDREDRGAAGNIHDDRRRSAADYLQQGGTYLKDGQKYYKGGQGLLSGARNLFK
jgi:hypothetical protein